MAYDLHEVEEVIHNVYVGLSEEELLKHSCHKKLERGVLLLRNIAVSIAMVLFAVSLMHFQSSAICKGIAYFLGAGAYFCEIILLTDCFSKKMPHSEMFMAYCFGPMYILLGISYFFEH